MPLTTAHKPRSGRPAVDGQPISGGLALAVAAALACLPLPAAMLPALAIAALAWLAWTASRTSAPPRHVAAASVATLGLLGLRLIWAGDAASAAALVGFALPAIALRRNGSWRRCPGGAPTIDDARPIEPAATARAEPTAVDDRARILAAVSHDLRQPIHAVGLLVAAIKQQPQTPENARLVERLDRSLRGVDELFDRLLEFGRLSAGAIAVDARAFALAPLLQTLHERFMPLAEQRGLRLRLRVSAGATVRSDPALVAEMLMNLLSNGLRYTERGGVLLAARRRGERVVLQVWDSGVGIEGARIEQAFDEFVQLGEPLDRRRKGLGLGLAIVRRLAAALGTSVAVRSRVGRGSVFEFALPACAAGRPPEPARAVGSDALRGALVLVVDDDVNVLIATEAALKTWGCFVLLARDERGALAELERSERFPDALIIDGWQLGGHDGLAAAGRIRAAVPIELPVLMVTGDADARLAGRARARGWHRIAKPAGPERLREALEAALAAGPGPASLRPAAAAPCTSPPRSAPAFATRPRAAEGSR